MNKTFCDDDQASTLFKHAIIFAEQPLRPPTKAAHVTQ